MIRPDQIPDEVVEVVARLYEQKWGLKDHWLARDAIAAAINAWPDVEMRPTFNPSRIILPLTKDNTND